MTATHAMRMGRQRGVALAMLLWMLAALTLLVSGVVVQSRTDVQLTRLHLDQARAQAAAQGAAHLLLTEMMAMTGNEESSEGGIFARQYTLDDLRLEARAIPLSGLVDLNLAPPPLLAALFQYLGGLDGDTAAQLAERLVLWRAPPQGEDQEIVGNGRLAVIEDLLRVPGMSRAVYDRVRNAVHAEPGGQQGVDPLMAPPEVLLSIANGDSGVVDTIIEARRDASFSAAELPGGLDPAYVGSGGSSGYRVDVRISQADAQPSSQPVLIQRIWVRLAMGQGGVPWQFSRVTPVEVDPKSVGEDRHAG